MVLLQFRCLMSYVLKSVAFGNWGTCNRRESSERFGVIGVCL